MLYEHLHSIYQSIPVKYQRVLLFRKVLNYTYLVQTEIILKLLKYYHNVPVKYQLVHELYQNVQFKYKAD